jgi:O-methyltransferase
MKFLNQLIKTLLLWMGYKVQRVDPIPPGYSTLEVEQINLCKKYSMTSKTQLAFLINTMEYIEFEKIPGDVVECGVWKGGSALLMAIKLEKSESKRTLWLYDTFNGMTQPTSYDKKIGGKVTAQQMLDKSIKSTAENTWAYATLQEVKENVLGNTSFPESRIKFIVGDVAQTLLAETPNQIALLRLDTDWYESTLIELQTLFKLVAPGGVVIIDDYGHWEGSKKATDEFLETSELQPLMFSIGPSRVFLKNYLAH